jgi:ABC-type branched-subunit amino acid transport system ATPase component
MLGTPIMQHESQDATSGLKDSHLMVFLVSSKLNWAQNSSSKGLILVKGKVHPVTGHEGSKEE